MSDCRFVQCADVQGRKSTHVIHINEWVYVVSGQYYFNHETGFTIVVSDS